MSVPGYFPKKNNIRAYYSLEDVNDGSGNNYNLTNVGNCTFTPAKLGCGVNLGENNNSKYLYVNSSLGIDNGGVITMLAFIKNLTEITANQYVYIAQMSSISHIIYTIQYDYNGGTRRLTARRIPMGGIQVIDPGFTITLGTAYFYQVGLVYSNNKIHTILNGTISAGTTATSTSSTACASRTSIGIEPNLHTEYCASSLIDEVTIWNTDLTAEEVLQVYKDWKPKVGVGIGSPMIFFKDAYENNKKLWKGNKLLLPKDLGFSY